jgi:hypothetical protein
MRSSGRRVTDEITLTIPRQREFHRIAHLVLGGLAARLDLTLESLEDLEVALDSILDHADALSDDLTVRVRAHDVSVETVIGPLGRRLLDEIEGESDGDFGLRRVLDSTVDDVHVDGDSVRLTKKVLHA